MEASDFSGYATKAGIKCTDGRTITPQAFQDMDGKKVPLVWQHGHGDIKNVLGHAILEARPDGVYAHGFFNTTTQGIAAKLMVQHEDITAMSIYANSLLEKSKSVLHGVIREVSLVLSGANKEALIDFVRIAHSDGDIETLADEAVIHTGLTFEHSIAEAREEVEEETSEEESSEEGLEHADGMTLEDIYNAMTEEEKLVVHYMLDQAMAIATDSAAHSDTETSETETGTEVEETLAHQEGLQNMNVFERNAGASTDAEQGHALSHADVKGIVASAVKMGSLKEAVDAYALQHGIENIDVMFPDAKLIADRPEWNKRRTEWVKDVLAKTRKTPFARIKTLVADITQDEARAKGYIKGEFKKEEWFGVTKRTTTPTTIYKKQKLDRDDIIDITDFDIVAFLKEEMRLMVEEEFAGAVLVGDGRDISDEDKVKDPAGASDGAGIRSILNDHQLYATTINVNVDDASSSYEEVIDAVMDGMDFYKGSGTPTFYTTVKNLNAFKKAKDTTGRRYYETNQAVADALGVDKIVTVDVMNRYPNLIGIVVNLADYNVGTDRGGDLNYFDDFDIDYNQMKYLMETRASGALVKIKSALIVMKTTSTNVLVVPNSPTFVSATGVITIPSQTGVVYKNAAGTTLTAGAQTALAAGASLTVVATPASGYYFSTNDDSVDSWYFKRPAA